MKYFFRHYCAAVKAILVFLLSVVGAPSVLAVDVEFPLVQSLNYFPYNHHDTMEKNKWHLSLDLYYSNVYMYDTDRTTVNDMETLNTTITARYGLTNRLTLEGYLRTMAAFDGVMDGFVIDFHKFFGMSEGGRHDFPRNKMSYLYKDKFAYDGSVTTASPLILGVLGNIYKTERFQVNGRLSFGLPLSSKPGFNSGKTSVTAGIALTYHFRHYSVFFANHISFFGIPDWLEGEELKKNMIHSEFRVTYRRFFGGMIYRSSPFKTGDLSHGAYQIYIGYRIFKNLELSLIEEFPPVDTVPDFTFNLRIKIL